MTNSHYLFTAESNQHLAAIILCRGTTSIKELGMKLLQFGELSQAILLQESYLTSNFKILFTGLQNDFCRTQLVLSRLGCGLNLVVLGSCPLYMSPHSATGPGNGLQMVDPRNIRDQAQTCKHFYIFWSNLANLMSSHIALTKANDKGHTKSRVRKVFMDREGRNNCE